MYSLFVKRVYINIEIKNINYGIQAQQNYGKFVLLIKWKNKMDVKKC